MGTPFSRIPLKMTPAQCAWRDGVHQGGAEEPFGLNLDIYVGAAEFLVMPLQMRPVCLLNQGRFEEPVRLCRQGSDPEIYSASTPIMSRGCSRD